MKMGHFLMTAFTALLVCHMVRSQLGTTPNIETVFKDRCLTYKSTTDRLTVKTDIDCQALWSTFSSCWTFRDPLKQNGINYDPVFRLLKQTWPINKSLFWSGPKDLAHKLSAAGRRYITLEDTLVGYVVDNLKWCGQISEPGINNTNCPEFRFNGAVYNYWLAASKWFASHAQGKIHVMLNGSNPNRTAYWNQSLFATVEMENLRSGIVTKITAILVHDLVKPKTETCGANSLLDLERDTKERNMTFVCVETTPEAMSILCPDDPAISAGKQFSDSNRLIMFLPSFIGIYFLMRSREADFVYASGFFT